jgi:hypothetical protein
MNTPDISADYHQWARAREWTWDELEYLLVGIDPHKLSKIGRDVNLDIRESERVPIRNELDFQRRLGDRKYSLQPDEAIEILKSTDIVAPPELIDAVRLPKRPAVVDQSPSPAQKSAQTKKYNRLLDLFLVVAIKKYGWRPISKSNSAVSEIVSDAELLGLGPLDDHTVRARLDDAAKSLSNAQKAALSKALDVSVTDIENYLSSRR